MRQSLKTLLKTYIIYLNVFNKTGSKRLLFAGLYCISILKIFSTAHHVMEAQFISFCHILSMGTHIKTRISLYSETANIHEFF